MYICFISISIIRFLNSEKKINELSLSLFIKILKIFRKKRAKKNSGMKWICSRIEKFEYY